MKCVRLHPERYWERDTIAEAGRDGEAERDKERTKINVKRDKYQIETQTHKHKHTRGGGTIAQPLQDVRNIERKIPERWLTTNFQHGSTTERERERFHEA